MTACDDMIEGIGNLKKLELRLNQIKSLVPEIVTSLKEAIEHIRKAEEHIESVLKYDYKKED